MLTGETGVKDRYQPGKELPIPRYARRLTLNSSQIGLATGSYYSLYYGKSTGEGTTKPVPKDGGRDKKASNPIAKGYTT